VLERLKVARARVVQWLDTHLVPDWRKPLKRYSVKLAIAVGTITTAVVNNQGLILNLLGYLPEKGPSRLIAAIAVGCLAVIIPTALVLVRQESVSNAAQAAQNAQGKQDG
jgi:hypothetical protein